LALDTARQDRMIVGRGCHRTRIVEADLVVVLMLGVDGAEIVFRMLIEVLGGDAIALRCRVPSQRQIFLKHLMGIATDTDVRAVAVVGLVAHWHMTLAAIIHAAAHAHLRVLSWFHVTFMLCVESDSCLLTGITRSFVAWYVWATDMEARRGPKGGVEGLNQPRFPLAP